MPCLEDIISRMCLVESVKNSSDSASWHADREAEKLPDPSMIDELVEYLLKKRSKVERKAAYFILGKMGKNVGSAKASHVLLEQLRVEKDKYALSTALDSITSLRLNVLGGTSPLRSISRTFVPDRII